MENFSGNAYMYQFSSGAGVVGGSTVLLVVSTALPCILFLFIIFRLDSLFSDSVNCNFF